MSAQPSAKEDTPAPTRRRRTPRRQAEILHAAALIFYEKGYQAASTQDIGDAVGLLKGSLYHYISSKEDLLFDIANAQNERVVAASADIRRDLGKSALVRLTLLIRAHIELFTATYTESIVYIRETHHLSEERKASINAGARQYRDAVIEVLQQGVNEGTIDPTIDLRLAAISILGLLNSMSAWYRVDGEYRPQEIANQMARLVISGLAIRVP